MSFPIKHLNISGVCEQKNESEYDNYDLIALVEHLGLAANNGHCVGKCRRGLYGEQWYKFDDENVFGIIDEAEICTNNAYILFYEKRFNFNSVD